MDRDEYAAMDALQGSHWWYLGRRAVVRGLWRKYARVHGDVLDLGCGTGEGMRIIEESRSVTGVDTSDAALSLAKNKGYTTLKQGNAEHVPMQNTSVDAILMLDVLEHIDDENAALRECQRVLRNGGTLLLTVPAYPWLWSGHDEVFGHKRRYTMRTLIRAVEGAGLIVVFRSHFVMLLLPVIVLYRLLERALRNTRRSHFFPLPAVANAGLFALLRCEGLLLRCGCTLPMGSSIVLVARKAI